MVTADGCFVLRAVSVFWENVAGPSEEDKIRTALQMSPSAILPSACRACLASLLWILDLGGGRFGGCGFRVPSRHDFKFLLSWEVKGFFGFDFGLSTSKAMRGNRNRSLQASGESKSSATVVGGSGGSRACLRGRALPVVRVAADWALAFSFSVGSGQLDGGSRDLGLRRAVG